MINYAYTFFQSNKVFKWNFRIFAPSSQIEKVYIGTEL